MKKVIVVTGASSGMGKEFLLQILDKEKNIDEVWAIARREDRLKELKKEYDKIVPIKLDLTNPEDLLKYNHKLEQEKPNIIILANCAGFGVFDHSENVGTNIKLNKVVK